MRAKIIAANWKMNMEYPEGLVLFSDMIDLIHAEVTVPGKQLFAAHSYIYMPSRKFVDIVKVYN